MSTPTMSSEHFRQCGNAHYALAKSATGVSDRRRYLWTALDNYKAGVEAAAAANCARDRGYCWKNSAVAHKELTLMEWAEGHRERAWDHLHASLSSFSEAWRYASGIGDAASVEWSRRFAQQFPAELRAMYSLTLSLHTDQSLVDNLTRICDLVGRFDLSNPEFLELVGNIYIDCANRLLHVSVSLDKKLSYGLAYSYIAKMHFPIKEANRLLSRNGAVHDCLERELETLREDQRIQETVFHSRVDLEQGKSFLQNLGELSAEQMTDEALLGMDHLRAALNLISEDGIDIVLEAEVCSNIGNLYLSYFRAESSAEKYFKRCIQLVLCHLTGDREIGCRSESWFALAERGLRTLQERQAKRKDDERRKELETDGTLADIKANYAKGVEHFLGHVYKTYPPRSAPGRPEKTLPDAKKPLKKRLVIALSHYHPDKVEDKTDRKWYYTCEEIAKYLNTEFEKLK